MKITSGPLLPRFAHLFGIGVKSKAPSKAAPRRAGLRTPRPAPVARIEPTVTPPKPVATSIAPRPDRYAHLGHLDPAHWSAMWSGIEVTGADAATRGERARMLSILAAPEAAERPAFAAYLAFDTDFSPDLAIGSLRASAIAPRAPKRISLSERMARVTQIRLGTETPTPAAGTVAAMAHRVLGSARSAGAKF